MIAKQWARLRQYLDYRTVFARHHDITQYRRGRDFKPTPAAGAAELAPRPVRVKALGPVDVWCRPGTVDYVMLWDTFFHQYHLPVRPPENVRFVLDLGANIGLTALSLAHRFPQARVVAVEMDAENVALCARNLAPLHPRCQVLHAAVWSEPGEIEYFADATRLSGHRVAELGTALGRETRRAPAKTLSEIMRECDIAQVDYLKMDIEGAEAAVLQPPLDWARRVRSLGLEIHPPATYDRCAEALRREGFVCERHPRHRAGLFAYRPGKT
jgi:FkbM family methyltransferase